MAIHVVLPDNLEQHNELERELVYLSEKNNDEYLETVRAYFKASLHFAMAWVFESANWILPETECEYWGLPEGTKVMNHPYCWRFINDEVDNDLWHSKLYLASRGFIKTTTAKSVILRDISIDPEHTWMYVSENKSLAIDRISRIKKEAKDNWLLKKISRCPWDESLSVFYDNPETERGSVFKEDRFNIRRRSARDEFTVRAVGLEKNLNTGDHYHRHCYDDCENKEAVNTLHMRSKMHKQHESCMSIRDNYDFQFMAWGTVYHYDGLHTRLRRDKIFKDVYEMPSEDVTQEIPKFYPGKDSMDSAGLPDLEGCPVFLGPRILRQQRREKKEDYYPQMMLDPRGKPDTKFSESYLRFYIKNPWAQAGSVNANILICIDGSKGRESGDPQAIGVFGHGYDDLWYVLDARLCKLDPDEVSDEVADVAIMWAKASNANVIGIIADGTGQNNDSFWIRKKLAERHFYFPVREIDCKIPKVSSVVAGKMREGKIDTFVLSKVKARRWVFPADLNIKSSEWKGKKNFVKDYLFPVEMKDYGFTDHDHFLDCMSMPFIPYKDDKGKLVVPSYTPPVKGNVIYHTENRMNRGSWMTV